MLTLTDLKSKCKQAMSKQPSTNEEESVCVLWQNEWVRILTVRDSDILDKWRIEVEVSLPSQDDPQSEEDIKNFIQNLINYLEYLLRLDTEGLTLSVISRDGLWIAFTEIEDLPPDSLLKALIPP